LQRLASVLLVDDDNDIMQIFKKALEREGYRVGAFSDPVEALEHYKSDPTKYDLLITDIKMRNMSGFELARQLKVISPRTKILFTTAFEVTRNQIEKDLLPLYSGKSEHHAIGRKLESNIIIPKPAKLEKVLASVKEVLSDYSSLRSPADYEHFVILYSEDKDSSESNYNEVISEYINGGLAKNQLCIYTYTEENAEIAMSDLSKKITNYEENVKKGNLLLVDFKPFCESAKEMRLKPFQDLMEFVKEKNRNRADQHVRIVGRAAGWLYENKHFDQCLALERWWHTKPFNGSLICPYKMSLFEHKQFFEHRDSLFVRHDTILRI
jgi:CheY-like chemotaxis protein